MLRRSLLVLAAVTLLLVVAVAGGVAALQTGAGRAWLASSISHALSSPDARVSISGISGFVPSRLQIARIEAADRTGVWLEIDDAALELRLRDLLRGQLTVHRLAARSVTVARAPEAEPETAPSPSDSEPFSLPRLPVDVAVDAIAIDRIALGEALAGQAIALTLSAAGALTDDDATAKLALDRVDGVEGHVRLDFRLTRERTLAVHLAASEPTGTVLQQLLGRPEPLPLTIAVNGEGPMDTWHGTIAAAAGADARLDAAVTLAERDGLRVTSDATVAAPGLLPPQLKDLLSQPVRIASVVQFAGKKITVERVAVDGGVATIAGSGTLDQETNRFSATATARVPELQPVAAAFDQTLRGAADLQLDASGTFDAPQIALTLAATQFDGPIVAEQIAANLRATRQGETWSVQGVGGIKGATWPIARAGLPDTVDWDGAAQVHQSGAPIALERFTLRSGGAEVAATGRVDDLAAPRGHASITLNAPDLARWQEAAGMPLGGRLSLASEIALDAGAVQARITGDSDDLATGVSALDALLGPRPDLKATVQRAADGALTIDAFALNGAHLTASANGTATSDLSALDARLKVDAPRLDVLSGPLGTPTRGAASVQAHLTGSADKPAVTLDATASDVRFGAQRLDRLSVKLESRDALAPSGTLAVTLKSGPLNAALDAAFARIDADTIEVSKLNLRAPGSELTGAVKVRTDQPSASGALTMRITDLSPWSPLAGTALAGAADARITLSEKNGQRADIDASVRKVRIDAAQAAVERIKIEARLSDLLKKPSGRANVDVAALTLPDLRIDSLRAGAQSTKPDLFAVTVDARGVLRPGADARPLRLNSASEIALAGTEQRARVTRLTGQIGDHAIASHAPLTVAIGTNRFKMDGLDLSIGRGRATASAERNGSRLALQAQLRDMPLSLVELAAPARKITGALDATVRMAGTAAQPDGQFQLALRDARVVAAADLPSLALTSNGTWKGERLDAHAQLAASGGAKLDVNASVPLRLDVASLTPAIVKEGALRVAAKGDGRLEPWTAILPMGEDRIGGRYSLDLAVVGTPAAPEPRGRLVVQEGSYVNFAAGTQIRDLAATIEANGRRFTLSTLTATDGAQGTLSGRGSVDLAAGAPAFDIATQFANFAALRQDDMTATADGEIKFAGTSETAKLSGHVRIDRAEIRVPDRLPPSIPHLQVVEVDSRTGEVLSKPEQTASSASMIALAVDVEIPARTFVRGRGLDSEWRGALHVGGTTSTPVITGKLETVRGNFSLLGKRFVLTDSAITFIGGERIDPQLGITAEYKSAGIVAQTVIGGTASDPSIKLTSQPEMPQDEILARVLFGRSVGEMTPGQGLELAQAAASLASGGPGLLDRFRMATGLDRLDISSTPGASGTAETTATAGKYISDGVFVGVEQGTKQETTRSKVEVEVMPNVTVDTSLGAGAAGVGVNWKWDY